MPENEPCVISAFIADKAHIVERTWLEAPDAIICVATVFTCVNKRFGDGDPPLLWETTIFWPGNENWDGWEEHYVSEQDAREGHKKAVALVKTALSDR